MKTVKRKAKAFMWRGLRFEVTSELGWTEWWCRTDGDWNWKVCLYKSGEYDARLRVVGNQRFGSGIHRTKAAALESALTRAREAMIALNHAMLEVGS